MNFVVVHAPSPLNFTKEQFCETLWNNQLLYFKDLYECVHKINYNLRLNKETIYMNIYGTFRNKKILHKGFKEIVKQL